MLKWQKLPYEPKRLRVIISSFAAMPIVSMPGLACSLVDVEVSTGRSISISSYYFIASLALSLIIASMDAYEKRGSIPLIASAVLLMFHPWWTVAPLYQPDCTFNNILASQVVLFFVAGMLVYRGVCFFRRSRRKLS